MDSHRQKLIEQIEPKSYKTLILIVLIIVCSLTLAAHLIKADKQSSLQSYNSDYFIENAIHQHEDCGLTSKTNKTFINYDLLGAAINDNWDFEFYVNANWQWYFIDERWNLNSSCSFSSLPILISLTENKNWYFVSNYYSINSTWNTRELYVKSMFSDNAYKNRRIREYWWFRERISFLNEAEQYFWIKLDQKWEFICSFCNKPRFFYEKIQNKEWQDRDLYWIKELSKQGFTFNSDWTLERVWIWGISHYNRYFWTNDSTIIIKDKNNPSIIERFIIEDLKDNEMTAFSEYIQI